MGYSLGIGAEKKIGFPRTLGIGCDHFSGNHRFHGRFSLSLVSEVIAYAYVENDYDLLEYTDASCVGYRSRKGFSVDIGRKHCSVSILLVRAGKSLLKPH